MQPPLQHQIEPSAVLIPDTVPPQIAGIAWYQPFTPPKFSRESRHWLHHTELKTTIQPPPPAVPSGIPWHRNFDTPKFGPVDVTKHKFFVFESSPATLPAAVSGIAWHRPWEPPFFPPGLKAWLHPTQFYATNIRIVAPPIEGMSWFVPFEYPKFRPFPSQLMDTEHQVQQPITQVNPIFADMWYKGWEPPFFPTTVKSYLHPPITLTLTPATLPPKIAGMAWWQPFDIPKQRKVDVYQMKDRMAVVNIGVLPGARIFSSVYIIF